VSLVFAPSPVHPAVVAIAAVSTASVAMAL
jgi:hypothetical protein